MGDASDADRRHSGYDDGRRDGYRDAGLHLGQRKHHDRDDD